MAFVRRHLLSLALRGAWLIAESAVGFLAGCSALPPAVDLSVKNALAPTGSLRVGVYPGSPTSLVQHPTTGERAGIALDLGRALAARLGVPVQVVEFERVAQVVDAVKTGVVDMTFTNATAARARDVDFTEPLLSLELGYIVAATSVITQASGVDQPGVKVGVTQGSSSQATLGRLYKQASLVPATSVVHAQNLLRQGQVQAYATNKAILFEMLPGLPGFKVLDGRWGEEHMAIAVPKGRESGQAFLQQFAQQAQSSGLLKDIIRKSGLQGTVPGR